MTGDRVFDSIVQRGDQPNLQLLSGYIDVQALPKSAALEGPGQGPTAKTDQAAQNSEPFSGYIDFHAMPKLAGPGGQARDLTAKAEQSVREASSSESIHFTNLFSPKRWDSTGGQTVKGQPADQGRAPSKSSDGAGSLPPAEFGPGRQYFYNRSGEPVYGRAIERKFGGDKIAPGHDAADSKKPMELPVLRTLGANASDVWREDKDHPDNVTESCNSFGKNRILFGYDKKNELDRVTKISLGKDPITFTRDPVSNAWYSEVGGERVYLPGKVEVRQNGDLAIEQKDGSWKIEEPSGALRIERTLPNHARLDLNGDGTAHSIKRPDGSEVNCQRDKGQLTSVDEKSPLSKEVKTWTPQADGLWTCSDKTEKPRRDLQVTPDGTVTFKTEDGLNRSLLSGGESITTGTGHSGTTFDSSGQLSKYVYASGTGSRGFERDAHGKINKFTEYDAAGEVGRTFTRDGDKSAWNVADKDGKITGVWQGEIATDACGGWSSISLTPGTRAEDLRWTRVDEKGNQSYVKTMDGGINITSDAKDNLTDVNRANDTTAKCEYKDSEPVKITTTIKPGGEPLTFTHDKEKNIWHCDNPKIADSKDAPLDKDGTIHFKTTDGNAVTVKVDGKQVIAKADGSTVDVDANGLAGKCTAYDGSTRAFQHKDGQLTGYVDTIKGKAESHTIDPNDKNQYHLTDMADLEYSNPANGTRHVNTTNLDTVDYNKDNLPAHVRAHNGSTRDIEYVPGTREACSITDTRPGANGPIASKLEHQKDFPPGSFSRIDSSKDGQPDLKDPRFHVQLDEHGNYSYSKLTGEGPILSRPGDQLVKPGEAFNSPDIDQARAAFSDTMRTAFNNDEKRMERMDEMTTKFEKRMADTIERRVAAGDDEKVVQKQVEDKVAETYRQLNRLAAAPDGNTLDDKATRTNFAETFMYHAMFPESVTQEGWNSCWNQSQWKLSLAEHPDSYAKMMADVSLTGQYTDLNHETHTFSPNDLAMRTRRDGVGWTIDNALHNGSQPSPVANRLDRLVSTEAGRGPMGITQGGYQQWARHGVQAITGEYAGFVGTYPTTYEQRLDMVKHGGAQRDPGFAGHIANYELDKVGKDWALIQGDQYNNDGGHRGSRIKLIIPGGKEGLENWVKTGQGGIGKDLTWEPTWGKEYTIADQKMPKEYAPHRALPSQTDPHQPDDQTQPADQPCQYRPQARARRFFLCRH